MLLRVRYVFSDCKRLRSTCIICIARLELFVTDNTHKLSDSLEGLGKLEWFTLSLVTRNKTRVQKHVCCKSE